MNGRNLKWNEFIAGEKYRVFKKPEHLIGICYPYIGRIGECVWSDRSCGVKMRFENSVERIVPINCLEEIQKEVKLNASNVKIGNLYRIKEAPSFWAESPELYAELGRIGILIKVTPTGDKGIIKISNNQGSNNQRLVPLSHLEEVSVIIPPIPVVDLSDEILISKILENPKGFLKIIKGLVKMNKEPRLKLFLERGAAFLERGAVK